MGVKPGFRFMKSMAGLFLSTFLFFHFGARPLTASPLTVELLDQMGADELPGDLGSLPTVPDPIDNRRTPAKIELGKMLFFDPRLSGNGHWACATCHRRATARAGRCVCRCSSRNFSRRETRC